MDIEGLGGETVALLYQNGLVKDYSDLYELTVEKVIPLEEAIRKLTSLPAGNLKIKKRGSLVSGNYADVVIFDPAKVQDHATFENPHQYSTGMVHVFVNGTQVIKDGEHTGAKPGRIVRGAGWTGWK